MNKGFTLIELLVVVLIIGILAAIALPQYTKAVERSRISEAAQRLGDMATAAQIQFMQTGSFPGSTDAYANTDVAIAQTDTPSFSVTATGGTSGATLTAIRKTGRYQGAQLQLTIGTDGAINKVGSDAAGAGNTEFSSLADGFGY